MYTIWTQTNRKRVVLCTDYIWRIATNMPATFPSVRAAREYYFRENAQHLEPKGTVWIKGPRGGFHIMKRP